MIGVCSQLAMQAKRANIRRILIARAMGDKGFVNNRQRVFLRLAGEFADGKSIFAKVAFLFETDVLHNNLIAQIAPIYLAELSHEPGPVQPGPQPITRNYSDTESVPTECKRLKTDEKRASRRSSGPPPLRLEASHVRRLEALGTGGNFEFDRLALVQRLVTIRLDGREVDENIFATLALNETKAFTCVEPLNCSLFFHV